MFGGVGLAAERQQAWEGPGAGDGAGGGAVGVGQEE